MSVRFGIGLQAAFGLNNCIAIRGDAIWAVSPFATSMTRSSAARGWLPRDMVDPCKRRSRLSSNEPTARPKTNVPNGSERCPAPSLWRILWPLRTARPSTSRIGSMKKSRFPICDSSRHKCLERAESPRFASIGIDLVCGKRAAGLVVDDRDCRDPFWHREPDNRRATASPGALARRYRIGSRRSHAIVRFGSNAYFGDAGGSAQIAKAGNKAARPPDCRASDGTQLPRGDAQREGFCLDRSRPDRSVAGVTPVILRHLPRCSPSRHIPRRRSARSAGI